MEEATGAPSSFTVSDPKRLRASGRDGETVMTEPPSPLRMLLSRHTKRREFITLLGGAAAAWPIAARAQQPAMPVIGFLSGASSAPFATPLARFPPRSEGSGLCRGRERGDRISDGPRSSTIGCRRGGRSGSPTGSSDHHHRRRPCRARGQSATTIIPIVFTAGTDPVKLGPRRQPQPAGRQCHRGAYPDRYDGGQATGAPAGAGSDSYKDRGAS